MNLLDMKPAEELFLEDLRLYQEIALEAVAPPDPLYLPGIVTEILGHLVGVRLGQSDSVVYMRLHANREGRFHTDEDLDVRVFRLVPA